MNVLIRTEYLAAGHNCNPGWIESSNLNRPWALMVTFCWCSMSSLPRLPCEYLTTLHAQYHIYLYSIVYSALLHSERHKFDQVIRINEILSSPLSGACLRKCFWHIYHIYQFKDLQFSGCSIPEIMEIQQFCFSVCQDINWNIIIFDSMLEKNRQIWGIW